jgi:acetate kinase
VVNCGSTSVKLAVFDDRGPDFRDDEPAWSGDVSADDLGTDRVAGIEAALRDAPIALGDLRAGGHRIVHGGTSLRDPVRIEADVEAEIEAVAQYAPLHNRAGLDGIEAARRLLGPNALQVAVFDTAFHRTLPPAAFAYGGPRSWIDLGLRRYGFHGISHQHAAVTAAGLLGRPLADLALVTCHLGGGCSLAAVAGGRSVDTTMGFSPLDGLVMSTRSGSVDPAVIVYLLRRGLSVDDVERVLEHESGLLGLSGVSGDLRAVTEARDAGSVDAALAIDVFVHRVATGVGAMTAALGRLDAVVFTGGIGEHSAEVRAGVVGRLGAFGAVLDAGANRRTHGDGLISAAGAAVSAVVVTAREEAAIAAAVRRLMVEPDPSRSGQG